MPGAGVNAASVAESALMMLLMLAKRAREQCIVFQEGGLGRPLGAQLAGKTLGVVGMGGIGRLTAHCAVPCKLCCTPRRASACRASACRLLANSALWRKSPQS